VDSRRFVRGPSAWGVDALMGKFIEIINDDDVDLIVDCLAVQAEHLFERVARAKNLAHGRVLAKTAAEIEVLIDKLTLDLPQETFPEKSEQ
jgi:hypothetical protein